MRKHDLFIVCAVASVLLLAGCWRNESDDSPGPGKLSDPTILIDTYEREVLKGCNDEVISDKLERRAAINHYKINPDQNIFIAAAAFMNLENGNEYVPSNVWIPGPGGDNLKWVYVCQEPRVSGCGLAVKNGDNRIEYKYWTQENPDVMGEWKTKVIHFTVSSVSSPKTCVRLPEQCPLSTSPTWKACL